ncbi:MAG: hypothetical protein AAF208_10905 [Cyanobacteria bacterium P01_A01_bin.45]
MPSPMNKRYFLKIIFLFLLTLGSVGVVSGSFFLKQAFSNSLHAEEGITDVSRYQEIRHQIWSNQNSISHFPLEIPQTATNIRLMYHPGFMENVKFLQVRFRLPKQKVNELLAKYQEVSHYKYQGGNTNEHMNQKNGVPTTFFYTGNYEANSFPPTYEILVLGANNRGKPGFEWNHGNSYGVAIDKYESEIVYWAEAW